MVGCNILSYLHFYAGGWFLSKTEPDGISKHAFNDIKPVLSYIVTTDNFIHTMRCSLSMNSWGNRLCLKCALDILPI